MRRLLADKEDTRQVFILMDALRGKSTHRQLARFRQTTEGQQILAERRSLLACLTDRARLAALPKGTLGRTYYEFMAAENLSPEGLVEASKIRDSVAPEDELTLFRERGREMHDLLHVTAGFGRDPIGEACVVAFSYAQTGHIGFAVIAFFGGLNIAKQLKDAPVKRAVFEAYRRGKAARWLVGADWEGLMSRPVDEIRQQFQVPPARHYQPALAVLRSRMAAQATGQPAMAGGN
jgi:ubiquinone biosynthesis protein COQ4